MKKEQEQEGVKAFSIRITSSLAVDIKKIGMEQDRSMNKVITLAIKDYVNNYHNNTKTNQ